MLLSSYLCIMSPTVGRVLLDGQQRHATGMAGIGGATPEVAHGRGLHDARLPNSVGSRGRSFRRIAFDISGRLGYKGQ